MHGSTSPSKNALPSHSCGPHPCHVTRSRTRPTARRAWSLAGSRPRSRSSMRTCIVESHPRFHAAPPHRPSSAWRASSLAPTPSVATLARSAATSPAGAPVRSRITCQRIDGSDSSSQSMTVTDLPPVFGCILLAALYSRRVRDRLRQAGRVRCAAALASEPDYAGGPARADTFLSNRRLLGSWVTPSADDSSLVGYRLPINFLGPFP